jgi:hypothetical protein
MNTILATKFIGTSAAFVLGGYHLALSHNTFPALQSQPASAVLSTFTPIYMTALTQVFLPTGFLSLASFGTLTYRARNSRDRLLYGSAAAMIIGFGIVTKFVLVPIAERLMFFEETTPLDSKVGGHEEVLQLLKSFTSNNWFRVVFALGAGLVALFAIIAAGEERASKSLL